MNKDDGYSDSVLVDYEMYNALYEDRMISDAGAKVIGTLFLTDSRKTPALQEFVQSGALELPAVLYEINALWQASADSVECSRLEELGRYAAEREKITTVQEWDELWLQGPDGEEEPSNRCVMCRVHVSEPHAPGCVLDLYDYKSRQERYDEAVESFLERRRRPD